ncbi:MAG: FAD-dependent oxidoreductase [Desulfovibrio sp.]|nr:FAD-dependent oxidoreductase [Desulfovibrio sp.]
MKVGIIGAGPAGLACALALTREHVDVTLFEAGTGPGGLCRSFEMWGMEVDLGPHRFFSMDAGVTDFWRAPLGDDFVLVDRLTRIFYKKKFFAYPIKPLDALTKLGFAESVHCGASYLAAQLLPSGAEDKTFAQWVSRRFGKRLFEIFFKSYSEKLWGISCDELDSSFAAQRIKGLSLYEAVKNALFSGKTKHKTLVEQFAYPTLGAGLPYERMAEEITRGGGRIHYNAKVLSLEPVDGGRAVEVRASTGTERFDHVVSTMPLTDVVEGCSAFSENVKEAARKLHYRNTIIVYLLINREAIFQDNWIYVHAPFLQTGRITNFRNWSTHMLHGSKKTILAMEYWAHDDDALWKSSDAELEALAAREIVETGLVEPEMVEGARVVRLHRSYPVYANGYEAHLQKIQDAVDELPWLTCIGRNGAFKYNNQDHSILMGMLAAENIAKNKRHPLWKVNTDYDYHEGEGSLPAQRPGH